MCLPRHDNVTRDRGSHASSKNHTDEKTRIHKVSIRCGGADYGKDDSACHKETLYLDEQVEFPTGVILDQCLRRKRASCNKENDGNAEVCYDCSLGFLAVFGDLVLGCNDDEDAQSNQKPLISKKPHNRV
jgi:hypothetical protein